MAIQKIEYGDKLKTGADKINLNFEFILSKAKSAYELWIEQGNTGTIVEFLNSLKGADAQLPKNLLYTTVSNNLFDKSTVRTGYYANYQTGVESPSANFSVSTFIKVDPSTIYSKSDATQQVAFYDVNKVYTGGVANGATFTTTAATQYIKVTVKTVDIVKFMLNKGATLLSYEPFQRVITASDLNEIYNQTINDTSFYVKLTGNTNLFNKSTVTSGYYVNYSTGTIAPVSTFSASDYIDVKASTTYTKSDNQQLAYYDLNKDYISGLASATTFTTPANAKYVRLSVRTADLDSYVMNEGTTLANSNETGDLTVDRSKIMSLLGTSTNSLKVLLPSKITIYKGMQFDIYFDSIIKFYQRFNRGEYYITAQTKLNDGSYELLKGKMLNYKWYYKPSTLETFKIEFRIVENYTETIVDKREITFNVVDKPIGKTIDIVTLGDSFTDGYEITKKLSDLMDTDGVQANFIGLHDTGKTGVKDDAWSGYSYEWYVNNATGYKRIDRVDEGTGTTSNQFFNKTTGKFDFSYYMSTYQNNHNVDAVIINLGLNDVQTKTIQQVKDNMARSRANVQAIIDSIKAYDSTIKVFLWLVPKQNERNDYISTYSTSFNNYERLNHNVELFNEMLLEFESQTNVYINATNANFDKENSYLSKSEVTNQMTNANDTVVSDIHPNLTGSEYLARTIYQNLSNAYV
ncbi:SGNH/GDSL hydrolase family protein [Macrococcus capreoli]